MSLDNEAVRLAYLGKANRRANEHTLNVPLSRALEGKKYGRGISGGAKENVMMDITERKVGGRRGRPKKQTQKDKEDEKLAMEVKGLKDEEMSGGRTRMTKAEMKKKAKEMGLDYGKEIMNMDDEAKQLVGSGFWSDFGKGFVDGLKMVGSVAKPVLSVIPHPAAQAASVGLNLAGLGMSGGKKRRARASTGDKRKQRGAMISKLMKEKGMSLGEASKYIKANNLI